MRRFAALWAALDAPAVTRARLAALVAYLDSAAPEDAAWGLNFLAGGRLRRSVSAALLRAQACAAAGLPDWLFEACNQAVGDLAETIALVLPPPRSSSDLGLGAWMTERVLPLRAADPAQQAAHLRDWWDELDDDARLLLGKLVEGSLRMGLEPLLLQRALAHHAGLPPALVAQRMAGWVAARQPPDAARLQALLAPAAGPAAGPDGQPYAFCPAQPLLPGPGAAEALARRLGPRALWQAEWLFDGLRAQLVRRGSGVWLWAPGEALLAGRFPEVEAQALALPPGTVLDGVLRMGPPGQSAPALQHAPDQPPQRRPPRRVARAAGPATFVAFDLLEQAGVDQRAAPLARRRERLLTLLAAHPRLTLSPLLAAPDWAGLASDHANCRTLGASGLVLKPLGSPYGMPAEAPADSGWWTWQADALRVEAVLVYAQPGDGRRGGACTDFSLAVWSRPPRDAAEAAAVVEAIARREPPAPGALQLVTIARAGSGLSNAEAAELERVIRTTTVQTFGPVRSLHPTRVITLAFEGVERSARHKSGLALRHPCLLQLRADKPLQEADSLQALQSMVNATPPVP